ncbi:MAG: hypothetical protein COV67_00230 [Nitrospinae bacterium CG11_big_fil_rev_8_21_14_0_20_56_8]|nr:MAG: hypothetical protein COV67_00230 [Nitrospinae bacterium CG11_big_fil_rev_8_21_14_0_20_56_8]
MKTYAETLDYLYGLAQTGIKMGLDPTRRLLDRLGNPQLKIPTLHIGGTNGKGSTAAFAESILRTAGHRTGLYTSPHLLDYRERIQIGGIPIAPDSVVDLATRVREVAEALEISASFFEVGTAMAFLHFAEQGTGVNIIEVGLGGRLDATNLCRARVSIITSVSRDHTQYLGNELRKIAWEKASIIKEGGTVFAHLEDQGVIDEVEKYAREQSARLFRLGRDFQVEIKTHHPGGSTFDFTDSDHERYEGLEIGLPGLFQASNAALGVAACRELARSGIAVSESDIRKGLASARWPGRMEIIGSQPTLILDCAHNPAGVKSLTDSVRKWFPQRRIHVIFGVMNDKPVDEMLPRIAEWAEQIVLVRVRQDRSMDPETLRHRLAGMNIRVQVIENIGEALQTLIKMALPDDMICITGSIFTVAEAKKHIATHNTHIAGTTVLDNLPFGG